MLIKNVCKATHLTKKAVEYYIEQGLMTPAIMENGYRDFSPEDVQRLKKIAVLRKLGLGAEDIRNALEDETGEILQKLSVRDNIRLQREKDRQVLLDTLSVERDWDRVGRKLESIDKSMTIAERLLDAFPGYYGRFVSLHFARFLNMPIETPEQQEAYAKIVCFLDNIPAMVFPEDVEDFLAETTRDIGTQSIKTMIEKTQDAIENPEAFFSENKETLDDYLVFKQSDEYKNSPAYTLQKLLKDFNNTSGYYDVFIPAMKKLSPSYADYCRQLERANETFLSRYPDMKNLNT